MFTKTPAKISETFCVMPWINLATETNGKCKICCVVMTDKYIKKNDGVDYQIQKDRIEDIWNSSYVRNVRNKMLAGERVADCFYCHSQEDTGSQSPRHYYNETWFNHSVEASVLLSKTNDGMVNELPTSLEPRPGITCNLKCNMCWSMSSSKIYSERKAAVEGQVENVPQFLKDEWRGEVEAAGQSDFEWSDSPVYLENLDKCMPTLRRLYFTGGEPTIIKSNIDVLEKMVKSGHTNLLISFTTNLQLLNPRLLELLPAFSRVEITGSIDGYGAVNDYIRYPSKWKNISANLTTLHNLNCRISVSIMSLVQVMSVFGIVDLIRWIAETFPEQQIQVIPTILQGPDYLRADILPEGLKQKAFDYIDEALQDPHIIKVNKDCLKQIRSHVQQTNPSATELRDKLCAYIKYLDEHRKTNFREIFPVLASLVPTIDQFETL